MYVPFSSSLSPLSPTTLLTVFPPLSLSWPLQLLSPSQSSVFTSHHHQHQHNQQLHYPSRNPSISSSAGGRGLNVPRGGSGARPSSDASNYSSAAGEMDTAWGKGGGVGGGGEARGRLYDAVMSQGQQGQGGRI